jgi:hypothetical protein
LSPLPFGLSELSLSELVQPDISAALFNPHIGIEASDHDNA